MKCTVNDIKPSKPSVLIDVRGSDIKLTFPERDFKKSLSLSFSFS